MKTVTLVLWACGCLAAELHPLQRMVEAARANPPGAELEKLIRDSAFHAYPIQRGGSFVWGPDFVFAIDTEKTPEVSIDGQPASAMRRIPGTNLWFHLKKMRTGVTHSYEFFSEGKSLAPRFDVAGYNPDSYPQPGVPAGTLSAKKTLTSKIYPGMTYDYWVYLSPGYDAQRGGPLMVWNDGLNLVDGYKSPLRLMTVTENLVHQKLIPPLMYVLVSPGFAGKQPQRSIQYDTVSDRYGRFLLEEVLPEVEKTYKFRKDGYSRGIGGQSSGGICSFTVAWFHTSHFSRVMSTIGSYTALQWRYGQPNPADNLEGGNVYPSLVRREPKRNIRVWMSDGADDNESRAGSWPLQNIQLANSLKIREYDFHFRFGEAMHSPAQGGLDMPEALTWLWRDYDPGKTSQTYEMEAAEKGKPLYRVRIVNRDAW